MALEPEDVQGLKHYGVKGQKWGTRHAYRKAIARGSMYDNTSRRLNRSANKLDKKSSKIAAEANGISAKKNDKLMSKANRIAEKSAKRKIKADRYHSAAQHYIKEAADTGLRSVDTPEKDAARVAINSALGFVVGNVPLAILTGLNAYNSGKDLNATAAKANKLQDERKGK